MSRLLLVIASLCIASCATDNPQDEGNAAQLGMPFTSGNDTPAIGTGIRPSDSALGLTPGFMTPHRPATRQ